jgi:hypothetical protein
MQQEYEEMQQLQQKQMLREQKKQIEGSNNAQQGGYPNGQGQYSSNSGYSPQQGEEPPAGNANGHSIPCSAPHTFVFCTASGSDANFFVFLGFGGLVAAGLYIKQNPQPSESGYANIAPEAGSQPQL